MQNQVVKIHSDFYYVKNSNHESYTCKLRELLKKQKIEIKVGDFVELSDDKKFINSLITPKNSLNRPKVSNIDLILVVCPLKEPDLDLTQLDRFLIYMKYHNIETAICFNKEDLIENPEEKYNEINKIYKDLGYKTFLISAKEKIGLEEVKSYIKNKTIALTGSSGAGKSTLLNTIIPNINLRTCEVSQKTKRGVHTTRHLEIIEFEDYKIADTPGFSCLKFDFILPNKLIDLFDDLKKYALNCKYSNCLHDSNLKGICSVVDNLDKIAHSRYQSYLTFLKETLDYKKEISKKSIKQELNHKTTGNQTRVKISKQKRDLSRKTSKQKIEDFKNE